MVRLMGSIASLVFILAACEADRANAPIGILLSVCHRQSATPVEMQVPMNALAAHKQHGDYVMRLSVDPLYSGADSIHFKTVTQAVENVRAGRLARGELTSAACRITIDVASGTYNGSATQSTNPSFEKFPIVIDVPDVTLRGAIQTTADANGRAQPIPSTAAASIFVPIPALIVESGSSQLGVSQEIIVVNGHPQGAAGHGAIIEGFVFRTGRTATDLTTGGQGVLSMRAKGLVIRGNQFEGGFTESVDLRASDGTIERNYVTGRGDACDLCIAGPGNYVVKDNRLNGPGGIPGILSVPAMILPVPSVVEQFTLPASSTITALITNNEVRDHQSVPAGVGIRIGAMGVGASSVVSTTKATVTNNNLVRNRFGIFVEAAFPGGSLRGDVALTTSGNTFSSSCQVDFFVSFSRHVVGLGVNSSQPYLRSTTYDLTLGSDLVWDNVWYANPAGFDNTLTVNGATIANGFRRAYDPAKVCP